MGLGASLLPLAVSFHPMILLFLILCFLEIHIFIHNLISGWLLCISSLLPSSPSPPSLALDKTQTYQPTSCCVHRSAKLQSTWGFHNAWKDYVDFYLSTNVTIPAHRGGAAEGYENTMEAFRKAVNRSRSRYIENVLKCAQLFRPYPAKMWRPH